MSCRTLLGPIVRPCGAVSAPVVLTSVPSESYTVTENRTRRVRSLGHELSLNSLRHSGFGDITAQQWEVELVDTAPEGRP